MRGESPGEKGQLEQGIGVDAAFSACLGANLEIG